jgi:hypothetical protein
MRGTDEGIGAAHGKYRDTGVTWVTTTVYGVPTIEEYGGAIEGTVGLDTNRESKSSRGAGGD